MSAIVRCNGLSKTYRPGLGQRPIQAVRSLTMEVEEREIFGFLGPNGAGKTTTLKMLMGLIFPTGGEAFIFDRPLHDVDVRRRLGFLPEHPYFYDHLTGREILHYFARLFRVQEPERGKRVDRLLERVGLAHAADQSLRGYSKGMLQRIGIAQALVNEPALVVLDEPMSGLDPVGRKEVRDLILDLRAEKRTVFFSTHILSDVEVVCDRVAIVHKGELVTLSPVDELLRRSASETEFVLSTVGPGVEEALAAIPSARVTRATATLVVRVPQEQAAAVLDLHRQGKAELVSMTPVRRTLEDIFMSRIGMAS